MAARREDTGWAVHVVRHGRLAAAGVIPLGRARRRRGSTELRASADTVVAGPGPTPAATAEESEKILRWLESDGVRLVHVEGEWTLPGRRAPPSTCAVHDAVEAVPGVAGARSTTARGLAPEHRPVR